MTKYKTLSQLLLVFIIGGCIGCTTSDEFVPMVESPDVLVINEGNFGDADGSFSTFNSTNGLTETQAFQKVNGVGINGIIQNAVLHQGAVFATTNSADKLEIFDASSFISMATISSGLATPYDFAASGLKGYVSNWGTFNGTTFVYEDGFIAVIDLRDYTISKQIDWAKRPQGLLVINSKLYVANVDSSSVSVISTTNDELITEINVPGGPDKMVLDGNQKIWVICHTGYLVRINPETDEVETIISGVQVSGFNEKITTNGNGDRLYYLSITGFDPSMGAVYQFNINDTAAPSAPIVTGNNLYGIGIHPDDNIIYLTNSNAFQGTGTVIRYQLDGTEIDNFASGRGPNGFIFR